MTREEGQFESASLLSSPPPRELTLSPPRGSLLGSSELVPLVALVLLREDTRSMRALSAGLVFLRRGMMVVVGVCQPSCSPRRLFRSPPAARRLPHLPLQNKSINRIQLPPPPPPSFSLTFHHCVG